MSKKIFYITKQFIWIFLVLLIGLGVRGIYLLEAIQNPDFLAPLHDAEFKDYWARAILSGDYTPPRNEGNPFMEGHPLPNPPGYPLFLAVIYWLTGGSYLAVRWVQIFVGVINIFLVYLLSKKLFNYGAGLFSAISMATYWAFVYYDMELNQLSLYIMLNLLCFYLIFQAYVRQRLLLLAFAGFVFGIGAWFRGEVSLLIFVLTFLVFFLFYHSGQVRLSIYSGLCFFLFAILPILPLALYNYYLCGSFTSGSHNSECSLSIAFHPDTLEYSSYTPEMLRWLNKTPEDTVEIFDLDGMTMGLGKELGLRRRVTYKEWRDYLVLGSIENLKNYPGLNIKKCVKRFLWTFSPQELDENKVIYYEREVSKVLKYLPRFPFPMSLFFLFLILYFISIFTTHSPKKEFYPSYKFLLVLLLFVIANIGIFSLLIAGSRYRVPLIPYFFIFGGFVFSNLWDAVQKKEGKRLFSLVGIFLLIFLITHIPFFNYQPNRSRWLDERRKCYQRIGDIEKGIAFFEQWLKYQPDADAHYHAGVLCYELDELEKAEEHFRVCLELSPNHSSAPYNLGLIFARRNNWDRARELFDEAVKRKPNIAERWFALGWAHENLGNTSMAMENYQQALKINSRHVQALNHSAVMFFRNGDVNTAKEYLSRAIEIEPNYVDAHFNLGQVFLAERKATEALEHFKSIIGKYQPEYELWKSLGLCYVQVQDYKRALYCLLKAKQMKPEIWSEDSYLAVCYAGLGMREECIKIMAEMEKRQLDEGQVFNVGHAWELLGEWAKAEFYYKKVLEQDEANADAWAGLGNISLMREDKNSAYVYFKKALEINPHQVGAWFNLILSWVENREWEKAKAQLIEFINYYPEHVEAHYNLGIVNEALGNIRDAKESYDKVLEKKPDHPGALFSRATIALSEMDLEKAEELFKKLEPIEAFKSLYHLGIVYSLKENWEISHECFLNSFFINPQPFFNDYIYAFNIGRSFDRLDCLYEAENFYRISFGLNNDFVDVKDALSFLLFQQGNVEEAYFLLNSMFFYQIPTNWSYYHFSLVWDSMDEPEIALSFAEKANVIIPNQSPILHQLGALHRKLKNYNLAEQYLEKAKALNPDDVTIIKTLAFLQSDRERYKEAKQLFITCTKVLPDDPEIYEGLADIYVKTGELKEAEKNYRKALEIKDSPSVINKLGLLLADLNKVSESVGLLEIAIKHFPDNAITLTRLADLKVILHSDMDAKILYEKALAIDSQNYLTHRNYADLLVRSGEYELAEKHYKIALELQPKDAIAQAGLGLLYARMNKYEEAKKYLIPLAQKKANLLDVNRQLALMFLSENQPEKAIKYIKRCILAQPDRKEFRELLQQAIQMK